MIDKYEQEHNAAAIVIQQAYRNYRAYKLAEEVQGVNPYKDSAKNLKKLKKQLIIGEGLSESEKESKGQKVLTEKETKLVDVIINKFQWTLKHATPSYEAIMDGGNQLLSLRERSRLTHEIQDGHTGQYQGNDDNVFFTLGSPNHNIAGFLDSANMHVVSIDLKKYMNNANKPQDIFKGLWYGDHWYSYMANHRYGYKLYGTTKRVVSHDQGNIYSDIKPTKTYHYTREDGTELERVVKLGDETVSGKDIIEFIALNLMLELRYIGGSYRDRLLSNPILANVEPAIDILFNSNIFEAKLPVKLPLDKNAITIAPYKPEWLDSHTNAHLMHNAAKKGDIQQIKRLLAQGIHVEIKVNYNIPLYTTICSDDLNQEDKLKCGQFLLENKADASVICGSIFRNTPFDLAVIRSISDVGCRLLIPFLLKSKVPDKRDFDIKYIVDVNAKGVIDSVNNLIKENHLETFTLLRKHGLQIKEKDAPKLMGAAITGLYSIKNQQLPEEPYLELINLLSRCGTDVSTVSYAYKGTMVSPLTQAIKLGLIDVIDMLVKAGANLNHHLYDNEYRYENCGKTPLMFAVENQKLDVAKKLLELEMNIEEKDDFGRSAYYLAQMYSKLTYDEYKELSYKNSKKTKQQFLEEVDKYKEIADYLKLQGAEIISKEQVLDYSNKKLIARAIVMGRDHSGTTKYLMGKEVDTINIGFGNDINGSTSKDYSFPLGVCKNVVEDITVIAKKGVFDNTLVQLNRFTNDPIKLHHYDKISTELQPDKYYGKLDNRTGKIRNIETALLFDVGDISKVRFNSVKGFTNIRWVSEEEADNLTILPIDKLLLKKAINPNLNLKEEIDHALDRQYDDVNQLLNKLLIDDKEGLIALLDEGYNVNAVRDNPKINAVLLAAYRDDCMELLKTLIERYGVDVNKNCDSITRGGGFPVEEQLRNCRTILGAAIAKGNLKLAQYLVSHGAEINNPAIFNSSHMLLACKVAIKDNNTKILDFLFSQGAIINVSIMCDLINSHNEISEKIISYIIDKGVDTDIKTRALGYAIEHKYADIAKLLIEKGADVMQPMTAICKDYDNAFECIKTIFGEHSRKCKDLLAVAARHQSPKQEKIPNLSLDKNSYVYLSTACSGVGRGGYGTRDIDYTKTLEDSLKKALGESNVHYLFGMNDEKAVFDYIEQNTPADGQKILHIMINAPSVGFAFSSDGLKNFKNNGGTLIVTAVEFASRNAAPNLKPDTLKYLAQADQIIFLDENDKEAAIKYQQLHQKSNENLYNKLLFNSKVINVPSTTPVSNKEPEKRGGDIISFGMIRAGKEFVHVRKLAALIKDSDDPLMKDKKILVVGTVQKNQISRDGINYHYDAELYKLMKEIYPDKINELENKTSKELTELYKQYQKQGVISSLPIELHLDVKREDLPLLFDQCTYSYLPAYRGATFRNSSISSALANKFVTYSHIGSITPGDLKAGGKYNQAMILTYSDDYDQYAR